MKTLRNIVIALLSLLSIIAILIGIAAYITETDIDAQRQHILEVAQQTKPPMTPDASALASLPQPVQRFFHFTFPNGIPSDISAVQIEMKGMFRRPKSEPFNKTTAHQTFATRQPALVFDARTSVIPLVWARAYDVYAQGEMTMKAKVLSAITLVNEVSSPELNRISLRRWLLESSYYPMALLPGGVVQWQSMDDTHARATVHSDGLSASMVATFAPDGRLLQWDSEEDGDLQTPYHGSGEHAARDDYRLIDNIMIPMKFSVARAAKGQIYPFWQGQVTHIQMIRATLH